LINKEQENYFVKGGKNYALHRPSYPEVLVSALASECLKYEHVLDVGCGSGQLSVMLTKWFDRVTATDPSKSQLSHAHKHPNIKYLVESAENISLPNNSVNLIVAAQAAHWFNLQRFYAEVERIADQGCVLALVSYGVPVINGDIGERLDDFYWKDIHKFWPEDRKHVEAGYSTLFFPYNERNLTNMTIERQWSLAELLAYIDTWSAIRKAKEANAHEIIKDFKAEISSIWPTKIKHRVTWPITARIATID